MSHSHKSQLKSALDFLVAQRLKHLPAMWESWVRSLDQEDPLEKEMATRSSILAWRIPWTEEPGRLHLVHRVTNSVLAFKCSIATCVYLLQYWTWKIQTISVSTEIYIVLL